MIDNQYKIDLGVGLNQSQLNTVKKVLESIETQKRDIIYNVDFNIKNIDKLTKVGREIDEIQTQLKNKSKNAIPIDTKNVDTSLTKIHESIKKLQNAFGRVDKNKGTQSLLTTVNKINAALGEVSKQFSELNKNLTNLSSKNFSLNLDFGIGNSSKNPEQAIKELNMLKKEVQEYENYFRKHYSLEGSSTDPINRLVKQYNQRNQLYGLQLQEAMGKGSDAQKISAYKEYIRLIKESAAIGRISLEPVDFRLAESGEFVKVRNEASETKRQLQELFSGGINAENLHRTLDGIEQNLKDISKILNDLSANGSFSGLVDSFNNISKSVEELIQNCTNAKRVINDSVGNVRKSVGQGGGEAEIKKTSNELTKLKDLARQIGQLDFKIVKSDYKDEISQVKEFERQLQLLKTQYNETVSSLEKKRIDINSKDITKEFVNARNKIAEFEAKVKDTKAELANNIKIRLDNGDFNVVEKLNRDVNSLTGSYPKLTGQVNAVKDALREMELAAGTEDEVADVDKLRNAYEKFERALKTAKNQLKEYQSQENYESKTKNQDIKNDGLELKKKQALLEIEYYLDSNKKAARELGNEFRNLAKRIEACDDSNAFTNLQTDLKALKTQANLTLDGQTQSFGNKFKKQWQQYSSYFSVASLFMYAEQGLRSMFEQVKLIDSAMTELKKVTNETDESYNRFLTNAATRSKEIGTTIDGLVSSTADFARLGYGFEDAQGLAEVANIYAVVGDEINGVEGATESLISTMAAFKDDFSGLSNSDSAMRIIDIFNELGNNFAISSGGLGEAFKRSASSLAAANNSIHESAALITAANTVVVLCHAA